jgi:hypothetical protein
MIRKQAVVERALVEESLARLVAAEGGETPIGITGEGKQKRDEVWWETWKELGCDLDRGNGDVWPVNKMGRGLVG